MYGLIHTGERFKSYDDIKDIEQALIQLVNNPEEEKRAVNWCSRAMIGEMYTSKQFSYCIKCYSYEDVHDKVTRVTNKIAKAIGVEIKSRVNHEYAIENDEWYIGKTGYSITYDPACGFQLWYNRRVVAYSNYPEDFVKSVVEHHNNMIEQFAKEYVAKTGLKDYTVIKEGKYKNSIKYNRNDFEFVDCKRKTVTYQWIVNLITLKSEVKKLKRVQKSGQINSEY